MRPGMANRSIYRLRMSVLEEALMGLAATVGLDMARGPRPTPGTEGERMMTRRKADLVEGDRHRGDPDRPCSASCSMPGRGACWPTGDGSPAVAHFRGRDRPRPRLLWQRHSQAERLRRPALASAAPAPAAAPLSPAGSFTLAGLAYARDLGVRAVGRCSMGDAADRRCPGPGGRYGISVPVI